MALSAKMATGASELLKGVCDFVNAPLQVVNLNSELVSAPVTVGLQSTFLVEGVYFVIGNDLAGGRVLVNLQMMS